MKRALILGSLIAAYLVSTTSFAAHINNSANKNISDQSMNLRLAAVMKPSPAGITPGKAKRASQGATVPQQIQKKQ